MPYRPPPLGNGFVWLAHTLMPSAKVQLLEQRLGDVRHQAKTRDMSELEGADDTEIELWVHPDDERRAGVVLHEILAGQ
jgi:hypothetical protein